MYTHSVPEPASQPSDSFPPIWAVEPKQSSTTQTVSLQSCSGHLCGSQNKRSMFCTRFLLQVRHVRTLQALPMNAWKIKVEPSDMHGALVQVAPWAAFDGSVERIVKGQVASDLHLNYIPFACVRV
jgi:hypothetical protein